MANQTVPDGVVQPGGAMTAAPTPYRGAAPDPARRVSYSDLVATPPVPVDPSYVGTPAFTPAMATAPITAGPSAPLTSPPPPDPAAAARLAELQAENGALRAKVGEINELQRKMEEMRLRLEIGAAAAQPQAAPQPLPPLPPGLDPQSPMSWADFWTVAQNVFPQVEGNAAAQSLRATWDVTPAEEADAVSSFPQLQNLREPERSRRIQEIAHIRRAAPNPANTPDPSRTPSVVSRPVATVPMVETTQAPYVGEPARESELDAARRAYEEASQMPVRSSADVRERLRRMRDAAQRINALQGVTEEMQRNTGFRVY